MDSEKNIVRVPDIVRTEENAVLDMELEEGYLRVTLSSQDSPVKEAVLVWKNIFQGEPLILADHWERAYGDMGWRTPHPGDVMPWYFLSREGAACHAYGVMVRPGAMCWWEKKGGDLYLHLDVRCGTNGTRLNGRKLEAAKVLMRAYDVSGEDTEKKLFEAAADFCGRMCRDSCYDGKTVYGSNNWYYAYGKSSAEEILQDSAYLAKMTEGISERPYMVIDDGWQLCHTDAYNGGPWHMGNEKFGDMARLAEKMKKYGVRPGIWLRPLLDASESIPEAWRLERERDVLDISMPEVLEHIRKDFRRIEEWGYELVKYDFSTYDIFGCWGFQMGSGLTEGSWRFKNEDRTTAELIQELYRSIYEASGKMVILGCNCIGHLGAGLMHLNRTGDDTSGVEWERTRKMGVNTLAFRMPQHGTFFGADADCVGITEQIAWEKNRQWMQILSESGTPFFVSVKPGYLTGAQEEELKDAYRKAAVNCRAARPEDWMETDIPERWDTFAGERIFKW